MFGLGDVLDKLNSTIDDLTGQDWLGDAVAMGAAIATGQYDEVAQHGLDLLEDGFELAGWEEGAKWAKYSSDVVDLASDLYHGRYNEALQGGARLYGQLSNELGGSPATEGPNVGANPTKDQIDESAAYWGADLLQNGSQGFMDALMHGNSSAKAALKSPAFMMMLQTKIKEENELISMVSNLIEAQHRTVKAAVDNIRV